MGLLEAIGGLNAQTARGPLVGTWARIGARAPAEVDQLCQTFQLVKINVMRGTVHLLTARQYWAWRPALRDVLKRNVGGFCRGLWDRVDHDDLVSWGTDLVSDGRQRTRGELGEAASRRYPDADPAHLGFAMRMILPLVEVPAARMWQPGRTRYVYAPAVCDGQPMSKEEGLDDLARSFASAFGSSAVDDFAYWSGMTKTEAARHASAMADASSSSEPPLDPPTTVLPEFDNVYFCRRSSATGLYRAKKDERLPPARMPGSLVAAGEVVAHWNWTKRRGLQLTPWTELDEPATTVWSRFAAWYHGQ